MSQFVATYGPAAKGRVGLRMIGEDTDTYSKPVLQATDAALTKMNYEHIYITVPNLGHDFTTIDSRYGTENNQFHAENFGGAVNPTLGDVNNDSAVTINDALLIARYTAGLINSSQLDLTKGDVTKDGAVNINDALMVARFVAGLISGF